MTCHLRGGSLLQLNFGIEARGVARCFECSVLLLLLLLLMLPAAAAAAAAADQPILTAANPTRLHHPK